MSSAPRFSLPYLLGFDGKPGRGEAGWTVASFASEIEMRRFMAEHPQAAMPCWKRI